MGVSRPASTNSIRPIAARTYFHVLMPYTLGTATVNATVIAVTTPKTMFRTYGRRAAYSRRPNAKIA